MQWPQLTMLTANCPLDRVSPPMTPCQIHGVIHKEEMRPVCEWTSTKVHTKFEGVMPRRSRIVITWLAYTSSPFGWHADTEANVRYTLYYESYECHHPWGSHTWEREAPLFPTSLVSYDVVSKRLNQSWSGNIQPNQEMTTAVYWPPSIIWVKNIVPLVHPDY